MKREISLIQHSLLLLADGRVAYMGPSSKAIDFFSRLNYHCPTYFNPADFYILNLAIIHDQEQECHKRTKDICDAFLCTEEAKEIENSISTKIGNSSGDFSSDGDKVRFISRHKISWGRQFSIIFRRSWLSFIRDFMLIRVRIVQTLITAIIIILVFFRIELDQKGVRNIQGALFLLVSNISFSNLFSVINTFPNEMPIFSREYHAKLYRLDVYFLSKFFAELPIYTVLPLLFITICYWLIGLYPSFEKYIFCVGVLVLACNAAVSFGLFFSALSNDSRIAITFAAPVLLFIMLFGGFFVVDESIPSYLVWVKYISWFKYSNELLNVNQWSDIDTIPCPANSSFSVCPFKSGGDVLHYLGYSQDNNLLNFCLLFTLVFVIRIFSFIALLINVRYFRN